jgi:phage replication initiation protein
LTDCFKIHTADLFSLSWRRPSVEKRGDWINENDKGRTLYIGKRQSGKLLRIYEKGLQLGGGFSTLFSNWVRVELELHNEQRDLPWDILLKPGSYLAGSYPALQTICTEQEVLETRKKSLKLIVDKIIEVTRHQFGRYIYFISSLFGIEQAFQILTEDKEQTPKRLGSVDILTS